MKIPKAIQIKQDVIDTIRSTPIKLAYYTWNDWRGRHPIHQSVLYLLGVNRKGVVTQLERLRAGNCGCDQMPHVSPAELTRAYIALAKKKTIGTYFGHFIPRDYGPTLDLSEWYGSHGHEPTEHPGRIFIRFFGEEILAIKIEPNVRYLPSIPVCSA